MNDDDKKPTPDRSAKARAERLEQTTEYAAQVQATELKKLRERTERLREARLKRDETTSE